MNKSIKTSKAPQAIGPYSQAIVNKNLVFISGQIHLLPNGNMVEGTIEEQAHQVMKNLREILKSTGVTFKDVVKATIYVTDISVFARLNSVYESYMAKPFPARELVCVKKLPRDAKIEISMIAMKN